MAAAPGRMSITRVFDRPDVGDLIAERDAPQLMAIWTGGHAEGSMQRSHVARMIGLVLCSAVLRDRPNNNQSGPRLGRNQETCKRSAHRSSVS